MATAKTGTLHFRGLQSGKTFTKAIYNADIANTLCRISIAGVTPGATGGTDYAVFPEDVLLYDCAFVTGITDTANLLILADFNATPFSINWASHVNTLATRPALNIGFKRGTRVSFQQIA